jgi:hypothetical protein
MRINYPWAIVASLLLSLLLTSAVHAAAVGYFTRVEGQVDVLKRGKTPAAPAKVNDGVENGDVIRTKAKSKAQVKFVDDSVVTMAPESRLAVADFALDAAGERRRAVLRFFKGVFHTVVSRIVQVEEANFLMETHTAVLGVRGTENYTVLLPAATGAYLVHGLLSARSNNPQIPVSVVLQTMQFTMIQMGQAPQLARDLTPAMLRVLQGLMDTGLTERALLGAGAAPDFGARPGIPEILEFPRSTEQYMQPTIPPTLPAPMHQQKGASPGTAP